MELIKVAETLIEKIKADYPEDVALVVLCGSYLYNDTHDKSDLDFYFIPKTERGCEMARVFILEDIGFDFWAMSWERAESLACYREENTSIVAEGRVIYAASEEDRARFDALRDKGAQIGAEGFYGRAKGQLARCYDAYFSMLAQRENASAVKEGAMHVLYLSSFCTALINQSRVKRGGRHLLGEILSMEAVPADFGLLYARIADETGAEGLISSCEALISNTRALIEARRPIPSSPLRERARGWFEEAKSVYNKLYHECEIGNGQGAMLAAARIAMEVRGLLEGTGVSDEGLPDLLGASFEGGLAGLAGSAREHEEKIVSILEREGVGIVRYRGLEDLRKALFQVE